MPEGRGPRRGHRLPRRARRRRCPRGAERARARVLHGHRRGGHARRRRGRDAAQGGALRQGRRPALRLHLGLDQVHARVGPRRVALLPGGDARGRRGRAFHRPADDHPRLRGHRERRSAGAADRRRRRAGGRARRVAGGLVPARAGGDLPVAGAEVGRRQAGDRGRARAHRAGGAGRPPAALQSAAYPGAATLGRGAGYDYPHSHPGHVNDQEHLPAGLGDLRFYHPDDAEADMRERLERIRRARGR